MENVEVFPSQISKAYPSPNWQCSDMHYRVTGWFFPTAFQGILTLWHIAVSATCLHSTSHWLWLDARKSTSRGPPVVEEGQHNFTGTRMDSFGFLWQGRIEIFPLLALPFALGLKMVTPCFVPCDDMWQKCILFLVILLQMTQTCSHSVNRFSLRQLMQNPLHANFSELQVIFDKWHAWNHG